MSSLQGTAGSGADAGAAKLALIGFMGSGKSVAAAELGDGVVDVDAAIEAQSGRSIAEIFATDGEGAFRELEERATLDALADARVRAVALGGGALQSSRVREALAGDVRTVWLDIELEDAWQRVSSSEVVRPLAHDQAQFAELFHARRPVYEQVADVVLPSAAVAELPQALAACAGLPVKGGKLLWAVAGQRGYPAYIRAGLLGGVQAADAAGPAAFWPATLTGRRVLVTDHNVARYHGQAYDPTLTAIGITPGERSKTLAQAQKIWTEMAESGVTRTDVVVALGGGVVGDLAGFCAATYQRGMAVVQVPTTLVAQVDSAYGGKTGVDLPQAKNYVGAFHQPVAVIADPDVLHSLPAAELAAGYAEVVKTALIAGGGLWELVSGGVPATDPRVIAGCALTKLRIVARDELDLGVRQWLNLGHTVGHAIETVTGYSRYRHGEAVAFGLLAALRLSGADELREQVRGLLRAAGLHTRTAELDADEIVRATWSDKKRLGAGSVPFVLCEAPGAVRAGQSVTPLELKAAVQELIG